MEWMCWIPTSSSQKEEWNKLRGQWQSIWDKQEGRKGWSPSSWSRVRARQRGLKFAG